MGSKTSRKSGRATAVVFSLALGFSCLAAASAEAETHAVVVGINDYTTLPHLRGAVADAKDISNALKNAGVSDLVTLLDADATRQNVLGAIDQIIAHAKKDDLAIITFAGHGGRENWGKVHPPGTKVGDAHEVFMLRNVVLPNAEGKIDPKLPGSAAERILGGEMAVKLKRLDDMGVRTIFVADTCHGGGLTREPMFDTSYTVRMVPNALTFADGADPLSTAIAALPAPIETDKEMHSLSFLAAVDSNTNAPEVEIPKGSGNRRGALSYAFARVVEGNALGDGETVLKHGELVSYVQASIKNSMIDSGTGQRPDLRPRQDFDRVAIRFGSDLKALPREALPAPVANVVHVFSKSGKPVDAVKRPDLGYAIEPTTDPAATDLIYDPASGSVFSKGGDLIASKILPVDLEEVAEREVAIRRLVELARSRERPLSLDRGDRRYVDGDVMSLDARRPAGEGGPPEYYLLVVISGNGKVQFQYPRGDDPKVLSTMHALGQMQAGEPFGADYAVFVSDEKPLDGLVKAVQGLDNTRSSSAVVTLIERALSPTMRIGLQGIYTAPRQ